LFVGALSSDIGNTGGEVAGIEALELRSKARNEH
jgi:hypothetical protein